MKPTFSLLLVVIGCIVVLVATERYGLGVTPDSVHYLAAADSLLQQAELRKLDGGVFVEWPPLLPSLIAIGRLCGLDPLVFLRLLNALCFGLSLAFGSAMLQRVTCPSWLRIAALLTMLSSIALLRNAVMAWAEMLLIVLSNGILFIALSKPLSRSWFLAAILSALALLDKYSALPIVGAYASVLALNRDESARTRFKSLVLYLAVALTPLALWTARNFTLSGTATGYRAPSSQPLTEALMLSLNVLGEQLVPLSVAALPRTLMLVVIVGCVGWSMRSAAREKSCVLFSFVLLTVGFIALSSSLFRYDQISDRFLAVVTIPMLCLAFSGLGNIWSEQWSSKIIAQALRSFVVVVTLALTSLSLRSGLMQIDTWRTYGTGGFSQLEWQESAILRYVKQHPPLGVLYSNAPEALYYFTGLRAQITPSKDEATVPFPRDATALPLTVIWIEAQKRPHLLAPQEFLPQDRRHFVETVGSFRDGFIYRVNSAE